MPLIKNAVGNNMKNEPSDMIRVKNALINAGYLEEPELHGYITQSTDNAIRAFQLANNLKVDGILKPGGETETALQWMPPVPGRKPAVPVVPLTLEDFQKVPAQKADLFKDKAQSDAWASWTALVDADTDLPDNMKAAFKSIYAWEGGMKPHKDSSVVAGITQETLKSLAARGYDVKPDQGHLLPKNLSQEKILNAYKAYFDDNLKIPASKKNMTGSKWIGSLPDLKIAAAVADTLFRVSPKQAATYIQNAINDTRPPGALKIDNRRGLGSQTYESLRKIAQEEARHKLFLDQLANQRMKYFGNASGDADRYDYYRFHGKK